MLQARTTAGQTLTVEGTKYTLSEPVKAGVDAPTPFKCGAPLEVHVESERAGGGVGSVDSESRSLWSRLAGIFTGSKSVEQLIEASVTGAGGETYQIFFLDDKSVRREPQSPTFTITAAGKEVASGKMEFG
jgi:hypothetical protein